MSRRKAKVVDLDRVRAADAELAAVRAADPEAFARAAERGAAWLRGELPGPPIGEEQTVRETKLLNTNVRLPLALVDRADRLLPLAVDAPELAMAGKVTRSDVLRLAILRGLTQLEAEFGAAEQPRLPGA